MGILMAAESWGVPPWVIAAEEPTMAVRQKWFIRFAKWSEQRNKAKLFND